MRKQFYLSAALLMSVVAFAQNESSKQVIKLPEPDLKQYSRPMIETLKERHSVRDFLNKELSMKEISTLCWAACGKSRDEEHITSPTAMNRQEIRLFVFMTNGVYEYIPMKNELHFICDGDLRSLFISNGPAPDKSKKGKNNKKDEKGKTFGQPFVMDAPITLLMVIDLDKFGSSDDRAKMLGYIDAGIVSENINLFCESVKLGTVTRATMDVPEIQKQLNLNSNQIPALNNPVGYIR